MRILTFLSLILFQSALCQSPSSFVLVSSDCLVTSPDEAKISSYQGGAWKANCSVNDTKITIEAIDTESGKVLSKSDYEYHTIDDHGFASSESGNVKYFFNFSEKKFCHGQVNLIVEKGIVVTKTSVGEIIFQ